MRPIGRDGDIYGAEAAPGSGPFRNRWVDAPLALWIGLYNLPMFRPRKGPFWNRGVGVYAPLVVGIGI